MKTTDLDLVSLNKEFERKSPQEIIRWAVDRFAPNIATTSSFGADAAVMIHLANTVYPGIRIFFLETGFHFPETLKYRDEMISKYNLKVVNLTAEMGHKKFLEQYGQLHQTKPDLCCQLNKVEPLQKALSTLDAWFSGIRKGQTKTREAALYIEEYAKGIYKFNPIANWTQAEVEKYIQENKLPVHPLKDKGYLSIGCQPCTRAVRPGEDRRAGRWDGIEKTECGIHTTPGKPRR